MEIFKNKFLQIKHDADNNICIANWSLETEKASEKDFKVWNFNLIDKIKEKKPHGLLANTRYYKFLISIELQEWSVINIFEHFAEAGLKKIAIINSVEVISQMALQQFIDEYRTGKIETKYFTEFDEAKNWLIS
jgi:hypothetical protein